MTTSTRSSTSLRAILGGGSFIFVLAGALFFSTMQRDAHAALVVGEEAPAFSLVDAQGQTHQLSDYAGKIVVLEWFNHGCPFVKKHYGSENMQGLQQSYGEKGVVWLAINSTRESHGDYRSPEETSADVDTHGTKATAVLLDVDGSVGRLYDAATTPHMYIVDAQGKLAYQGAIDSNSSADPDDIPESTNYVKQALDEMLAGGTVSTPQTKSYGCSVKY